MTDEIYTMQECPECRKVSSGKCVRHMQQTYTTSTSPEVDAALRRYMVASVYDVRAKFIVSAEQFDADNAAICKWLDGDA